MAANPRIVAADERRRVPRSKTLRGALVVSADLTTAFDCVIRNLGDDGAKVALETTLGVPDTFRLLVPSLARIVPARAIWRNSKEIGLAFTGPWEPHSGRG